MEFCTSYHHFYYYMTFKIKIHCREIDSIRQTAPVASMEYWAEKKLLWTCGGLYLVKKIFTIIYIENETDARVYGTVLWLTEIYFQQDLISKVAWQWESHSNEDTVIMHQVHNLLTHTTAYKNI